VPIIRRDNCVYVTLGTCYSVWMTVWYAVCRQSSTQNNKYQVSYKHSSLSWWWAHSSRKHVEIDKYSKNKYTKNKLFTKLALVTILFRDAQWTKYKTLHYLWRSYFILILSVLFLCVVLNIVKNEIQVLFPGCNLSLNWIHKEGANEDEHFPCTNSCIWEVYFGHKCICLVHFSDWSV